MYEEELNYLGEEQEILLSDEVTNYPINFDVEDVSIVFGISNDEPVPLRIPIEHYTMGNNEIVILEDFDRIKYHSIIVKVLIQEPQVINGYTTLQNLIIENLIEVDEHTIDLLKKMYDVIENRCLKMATEHDSLAHVILPVLKDEQFWVKMADKMIATDVDTLIDKETIISDLERLIEKLIEEKLSTEGIDLSNYFKAYLTDDPSDGQEVGYESAYQLQERIKEKGDQITEINNQITEVKEGVEKTFKTVTQAHTFPLNRLVPLYFNGTVYELTDITNSIRKTCTAVGLATDNTKINLYVSGYIAKPSSDTWVNGNTYSLSQTIVGGVTEVEYTTGIIQDVYNVELIDGGQFAKIDIDTPLEIVVEEEKESFLPLLKGFDTSGEYVWTVPTGVSQIKVTLGGGGGGGNSTSNNATDGGYSKLLLNGAEILKANGGLRGKYDNANTSAPEHATATGGSINVLGGGGVGGLGVSHETGGDNEGIGGDGANGGLALHQFAVVGGDRINLTIGHGGQGGTDSTHGGKGGKGSEGYCTIEY